MQMATEERYKMGVFETNQRPSIEELASVLDDEFQTRETEELEDEELVYKEKGRNVYLHRDDEEEENEYDYCHFRYVADTKESYRIRNEDDEEDNRNDTRLTDARVMYFRNGQFAFESRDGLEPYWIPDFISHVTDSDVERSEWRLYTFGSDFMKRLYDDYPTVSILKLAEPRDVDQVSSEIGEFIINLSGEVDNFQFSTGQGGGNLKSRSSIDTCAQHLDILKIHMKREGGYTESATRRGTLVTKWEIGEIQSEETEARQRLESLAVRRKLWKHLESLEDLYN